MRAQEMVIMVETANLEQFDDDSESIVFSKIESATIDKFSPDQLKLLCDHDRRIRRMRAFVKVVLAVIAQLPILFVLISNV